MRNAQLSRFYLVAGLALASVAALLIIGCGESEVAATPVVIRETVVVPGTPQIIERTVVVAGPAQIVKETVVVKETSVVQQTVVVVHTATPTTAPVTTPTAAPLVQAGTLRVAVGTVPPPVFLPSKLLWPTNLDKVAWGVVEPLTYHGISAPNLGEVSARSLAESWTVAADGTSVTFKIRKGVLFHEGWGELTAKDVAYTFDEAFKQGSLAKIAEEGTWMSKWVVVDDNTITMTSKPGEKLPPLWARILSNNSQIGGIWSKAVFDKLGADKASQTPIGTGPFRVQRWVANDQVLLEAQTFHYRETPKVKLVLIREIPEEATRLAAFIAGEVDISPVSLRFLKRTLDQTGAHSQETNTATKVVVYFGGNYWAKNDLVAKTTVPRRTGLKPDDAHAWIGDPDNPAQFEKATKVRRAMAYAIDRDAINKTILTGLGQVGPGTWFNFAPTDAGWKTAWAEELVFSVAKGKALLRDAGYPNGFTASFFVPPDVPAIVDSQVGQAIAQMWRDNLGIDVKIESTAYAAKRPTIIDRSFSDIYIWTYGTPAPDEPQVYGQYPSLGWNPGVEIPCVAEAWYAIRAELDIKLRLSRNIEAQDCLDKNAWNTIIHTRPVFAVVAKNVTWKPTTLPGVDAGDFEKATIAK
ncbi:MAG: ABC transporter substrate-binding protein [Dehalococcoidia bacterium]|nr:ABC transporter substrate-binding protein [Dehalococcoidia bacterium]